MLSKNMQYAFQKEYQERILLSEGISDAKELNNELLSVLRDDRLIEVFNQSKEIQQRLTESGAQSFSMSVGYPGLLIGTGYPHMTGKKVAGEINIGFSFDYVTGMPFYPGSSLKGVLRNPFQRALNKNDESSEEYREYLSSVFQEVIGKELSIEDIKCFVNIVFDGKNPDDGNGMPMASRDIFYGAYPIGFLSDNPPSGLLQLDNLTPHLDKETHEEAPLKDPESLLTLLRVAPNVCLAFYVKLHDLELCNGQIHITAEDKIKVFKTILKDFGIGAKTHVGYGNLSDCSGEITINPGVAAVARSAQSEEDSSDETLGPLCQNCGKKHVQMNESTKTWGKYCSECLPIMRQKQKEKKEAEKKAKREKRKNREE